MKPFVRRAHDDAGGAVAVIAAITLTLLLLMAAFVVDLGFLRADRIGSQSTADMAAAGAAVEYLAGEPGSAQQACLDAQALAIDNLYPDGATRPAIEQSAGDTCEAQFPTSFDEDCADGAVSGLAVLRVGPHTIEIAAPVPNGSPLLGNQDAVAEFDGLPCERLAVRVLRDRNLFFGGFTGVDASTTTRWAVARSFVDDGGDDIASLVVLELTGCRTLRTASSSTNIRVFDSVLAGERLPGNITVDTRDDCNGGSKIIDPNSSSRITTGGRMIAHALASTDPSNNWTYDASLSAFSDDNPGGQLSHAVPGPRQTRSTVDHRYNCRTGGYPADSTSPARPYRGVTLSAADRADLVPPCPSSGPDRAYIDALRTEYQPLVRTSAEAAGFQVITGAACNQNATYTAAVPGTSRIYVDCDGFPAQRNVTFTGYQAIVVKNELNVQGSVTVTGPADTGTILYLQRQGIAVSGDLRMRNVFSYIEAPVENPGGSVQQRFYTSGSTGVVALQAPLDESACPELGAPNASCFAPLALWSNGGQEHGFVSNNANGGIVGSVFTPNAPFKLRSDGDTSDGACPLPPDYDAIWARISAPGVVGVDMEAAQFFARSIDAAGNSTIRMCPNPDTNIPTPIRGFGLIR